MKAVLTGMNLEVPLLAGVCCWVYGRGITLPNIGWWRTVDWLRFTLSGNDAGQKIAYGEQSSHD
ncbi:hypothetical protein [Novosphingobium barchaimii]|uniref:hypothetical protein n=1 Tax=Novosphingobium barchaimii TaxID=1420591 RepID=UPI000B245BA0|nr:hypothetical protein [Novosphingobium barchaimii]